MAETVATLRHRPAGDGIVRPGRHGRPEGEAGLAVTERHGFALATLQVRKGRAAELARALKDGFGLDRLPGEPRKVDTAGGLSLIGIGPGRWLALRAAWSADWPDPLAAAAGEAAAVTDQSGAYALLTLAGPSLPDLLAALMPLDLHPSRFPPGHAATTSVALIGVTLWRTEAGVEMLVPRTMVGNFWHALEASGARYGIEVGG